MTDLPPVSVDNLPSDTTLTEVLGNRYLGDGISQTVLVPFDRVAQLVSPYAEEWAQSTNPISVAAGGDGVSDRSSKFWALESWEEAQTAVAARAAVELASAAEGIFASTSAAEAALTVGDSYFLNTGGELHVYKIASGPSSTFQFTVTAEMANEPLMATLRLLSDEIETIGITGAGVAGSTVSGGVTFAINDPVDKAGFLRMVRAYNRLGTSATVYIKRFTKSGDTFSQAGADLALVLAPGANAIEVPKPFAVNAGDYLGFYTGSDAPLTISGTAPPGFYSGSGFNQRIFTDSSATTGARIQIGFDVGHVNVTATRVRADEKAVRRKMEAVPPLAPTSYVNAVRKRYGLTSVAAIPLTGTLGAFTNAFSAPLFDEYQEPNAIRVTGTSGSSPAYLPVVDIVVTPADLALIGVVPSDSSPPVISARAAIMLANLVNQTMDAVAGSLYGQVWLGLRYDGSSGSSASAYSAALQDIVFANNAAGPFASYYVPSPNPFSAIAGQMLADTARLKGYKFQGVPVYATINGKALTHIKIKVYGRAPAIGAYSLDLGRLALVAGATIDDAEPYFNSEDHLVVASTDPGSDPASTSGGLLTVQSASKVAVIGDSFTESVYTPRGKSYLSKLSQFSEYNFDNFAVSGETLQMNLGRLRSGELTYGSKSYKDYGVTYALLMCGRNDVRFDRYSDFLDDIRAVCESVRGAGAIPVVATEFVKNEFGGNFQIGMAAAATEQGGHFINLLPAARRFDPAPSTGRDLALWGAGHPGVRTNELLSAPLDRFVRSLPRPLQSLKVFRKRAGVSVSSLDTLMYDTPFDRARLFAEIDVGHAALVDASTKYMDELNGSSYTTSRLQSEYLKLQAGVAVTFADYATVDAILPGTIQTIESVALIISDPSVTVYVRDVLAAPYETAAHYQRFAVGSPTVSVGATYTSDAATHSGTTFTVVGLVNGQLIMSPMDSDQASHGAGTLTKTSGSGDASIAFTATMPGSHPDYYTNLGKPEGHWVALTADEDDAFPVGDLAGRLLGDRVQFLLYRSGGFSLSDIRIRWTGQGGKAQPPRIAYGPPRTGAELVAQPLCGTSGQLASWTVEGSLTPGKAADDSSDPPYGATGYVTVTDVNRLRTSLTITNDALDEREIEVRVWARRWPSKVSSSTYPTGAGITGDSFDWSLLKVELTDGTLSFPITDKVGLWWDEVVFRLLVPAGSSSIGLRVGSAGDPIQVARVSAKMV